MNAVRPLSRRALFRGAAGFAVALPFLEAMEARGATRIKRYLCVFTPSGTIPSAWTPIGSETSFTLSPILAPLEPLKSKIIVLDNVDSKGSGPGDGHQEGITRLLTCRDLQNGSSGLTAGGISVDQYVAQKVGASTRFRSIELGVGGTTPNAHGRISYLGPDRPMPPERSPLKVYDRLFATFTAPAGTTAAAPAPSTALQETLRQRKSVLDSVMEEYVRLDQRLGASDRRRLQHHLESLREIERRLTTLEPTEAERAASAACARPARPGAPAGFPEEGKLQMDLLAMAFACNLTRVATLQWTRSTSSQTFPWLGIEEGHHALSHRDGEPAVRAKLIKINAWYAEQYAYLLKKLDSYGEGGASILDNTVALWGNELGTGGHTRNDIPFVLAGSCGGVFRTGRYLKYSGASHADLHVACLNALDIPDRSFGAPELCEGPLPGLT